MPSVVVAGSYDTMARVLRWAIPAAAALAVPTIPANAYLFWTVPDFSGPAVRGDEPGITLPLPGARPEEVRANLVWTLRAALNVAALQCQFARPLMTVSNYNTVLSQHRDELSGAYTTLGNYFRRTKGKVWQRAFDSYTTQSYNGLSTFHAQIGFCEAAGQVGKSAIAARRGNFHGVAEQNMRKIRNALIPQRDQLIRYTYLTVPNLPLDDRCWDRKGRFRKECAQS